MNIPDEDYTFQDAYVEAKSLHIPAQMTGLGLRFELSATESVRCATPLVAREELRKVREAPDCVHCGEARATVQGIWCQPCFKQLGDEYMAEWLAQHQ